MNINKTTINKLKPILILVVLIAALYFILNYLGYTQKKASEYPLVTVLQNKMKMYYGDINSVTLGQDVCKSVIDFLYNRGLLESLPTNYSLSERDTKNNLELYKCEGNTRILGPYYFIYIVRNTGNDYGLIKYCVKSSYPPGSPPRCESYSIEPRKIAIFVIPLRVGVGEWIEL